MHNLLNMLTDSKQNVNMEITSKDNSFYLVNCNELKTSPKRRKEEKKKPELRQTSNNRIVKIVLVPCHVLVQVRVLLPLPPASRPRRPTPRM